jgi:hypothetical protein
VDKSSAAGAAGCWRWWLVVGGAALLLLLPLLPVRPAARLASLLPIADSLEFK